MINFSQLESIAHGKLLRLAKELPITNLLTDSRKALVDTGSVFFAINGVRHDGHRFLKDVYETGVRQFVVEQQLEILESFHDANILLVSSSLDALQSLAMHQRKIFTKTVVGITGSNGKTIVKEWLYQLLSPDFKIAKNPGSYNSQLGVPLSIWQLDKHHDIGIFEAGISKPGEMKKLADIIQPTIGIFTNIGHAHDEGFSSMQEKLREKLRLFNSASLVIASEENPHVKKTFDQLKIKTLTWSFGNTSAIQIQKILERNYNISHKGSQFNLELPFVDPASVENCFHCVALLLHLKYSPAKIQERILALRAVPMRLELKEGINQSQIIDDTYNNDLSGLKISLEFLSNQQQKQKKRVIFSDILESGVPEAELVKQIATLLSKFHVTSFIGIGESLLRHKSEFPSNAEFFSNTESFLNNFELDSIAHEVVLVKGARAFKFERIIEKLQKKVHGTVMEIDLGGVVKNLNFFRSRLQPSTKIMVMVKAFAYGSGSNEIANLLQYHRVDYLGVAYADEGVDLRKNNISLPIMVMNPSEETFDSLITYNLEPEIYNFRILNSLLGFLNGRQLNVHVKIDTGMHRLGFDSSDVGDLLTILKQNKNLNVASVFSHLAGADEAQHDEFSAQQADSFLKNASVISDALGYKPLFHILNSPGILRLPQFQFDMVRLGIGLYGVNPTSDPIEGLQPVATLKTIISQVKKIRAGETIGYGRRGKAEKDISIATIAIGYADGFSRAFSRGIGRVLINGQLAPVVGNVCMDMTMVDITGLDVKEGDEAIIFGRDLPIQSLASSINTIPYEILTSMSERVKRLFVAESM
jgi:alanine racemase